ncbi:MAG: YgeY family selenium metabolism-linked hydrolase [Firmicutes bacterium]|jgi:putative selenium metabolism hydrolase|nr:YgeY family selenium metabolism-linked hydrolase [Bacillota bacterium]
MVLNAARREQVVALCKEMVRRPSLSGHEEEMAALMRHTMTALGYDEVDTDRYGNVVGVVRGAPGGKRLLFEGHMDHVEVSSPERWTKDPFGGVLEDGRIYGRGSSDMKGSIAAMLLAAAYVREDCRDRMTGEILVAGSVHEECFEGVASREIGEQYRPDYVVIGEASQLNLKRGQRGRAEVVIETVGRPAHSSNPEAGLNAVKKMVKLLSAVEERFVPSRHPVLGKGILELTDIISSPYPGASVVPERCRVTFDRRLLVGESEEDVLGELRAIVSEVQARDPDLEAVVAYAVGEDRCYTGNPIKAKRFMPAWLLDEDHEFVQEALAGLRAVGLDPQVTHYSFCTDGSYYAGVAGIPTIGFGPSREDLAHVVDEYIEVDQLVKACEGFYGIARSLLVREK